MLVLSRNVNESIIATWGDGSPVLEIMIVGIKEGKIRLGFTAPKEIGIYRKEVFDEIKRSQKKSNGTGNL